MYPSTHTHIFIYLLDQLLSHVQLFAASWTVACQAPPSMEFSRQEYWSGMTFPSPGDLPDPEIKSTSPALAGGFLTTEPHGKPLGFLGQVRSAVSGSASKLLISPPLP